MWLAVEKFLIAFFLPILGFFSFPNREAVPPPAGLAAAVEQTVPQPTMRGAATNDAKAAPSASSGQVYAAKDLSLAALKDCLNRAGESGSCLDAIFQDFFKIHTTADALIALGRYQEADTALKLSCHPVVHAIGRETFRLKGTVQDSFAECDQTCHSGCYHGAMERFLRGNAASDDEAGHISVEELRQKAAQACDPNQPTRFRFQCLHGLGHALMFFSDYRLGEALASCDVLSDGWSRSSCYGGLFMENVFSATPEKRDLSPHDYHYPCNVLDEKYRSDCYMMQTTRMTEMGLGTERLFEECRKARLPDGQAGGYQFICMQSIGRDLSNDARIGDPRLVAQKCELGSGEERRACTRGVVYALIDNTWDGRYAMPFCNTFGAAEDVSYCYTASAAYLRATFEKSGADIAADCHAYAAGVSACLPR